MCELTTSGLRLDDTDLEILKILVHDCRTSYHSIGKTLNMSTNTAKTRVNNLISSKVIECFTTIVNLSVFGYTKVLTVVLRHPTGDNSSSYINEIANFLERWGLVYMLISAAGGISAFGIAIKDNSNGA